jgi:hypothetical protein
MCSPAATFSRGATETLTGALTRAEAVDDRCRLARMAIGGGPIWGESVRKSLNASQDRDAQEHEASAARALLDEAELRELERSEVYGEAPPSPQPTRRRSLFDRLFRR